MPNLAEALLARLTDRTRAAAIMGDLAELGATRGRLWFWTNYARTLLGLGWRAPIAFLVAIASMRFMFRIVLPWLADAIPYHLSDAGLFGQQNLRASLVLWNFSMVIAQCLVFALPFAIVRFGSRNRMTQLAAVLLLFTVPVYTAVPWVRDLSSVLTALVLVAALVSPMWRKPLLILTAMGLTAIAVVMTCGAVAGMVFHQNFYFMASSKKWACDALGVAIATVVCLNLHRRLLRQHPAIT